MPDALGRSICVDCGERIGGFQDMKCPDCIRSDKLAQRIIDKLIELSEKKQGTPRVWGNELADFPSEKP